MLSDDLEDTHLHQNSKFDYVKVKCELQSPNPCLDPGSASKQIISWSVKNTFLFALGGASEVNDYSTRTH